MYDDIKNHVKDGFDAVICLGNSFAHLLDSFSDQREHKQAISNFEKCLKPGGILLIDHRNYDNILETGSTPAKSIYYNVSTQKKICVVNKNKFDAQNLFNILVALFLTH